MCHVNSWAFLEPFCVRFWSFQFSWNEWRCESKKEGKHKQNPKALQKDHQIKPAGFRVWGCTRCSELNASRADPSFKNYSFSICFSSICNSKAWLMENNLLQWLSSPDACNLIINLEYTSCGSQGCWERTLGREGGGHCSVCFPSN